MARSVLVLSWWLALLSTRHSLFFVGAYECHLTYPISLLQPVTGSYFSGNLSSDHLTCFGNREYLSVSYLDAIRCLVRGYGDCNGLWGSRAVVLETDGSMEMLRVQKLPAESVVLAQPLNASRWLQLSAAEEGAPTLRMDGTSRVVAKEAKQIPAEPVFFCARCNDWRANSSAAFTAQFRQAYLRQKDVVLCRKHMLVLVALTAASAAVPAISKLLVVAAGSYGGFHYGLQRFIMVYVVCMLCTVLLPFVRGKRTRRFIRYYMRAFLSKEQVS